MGRNPGSIRTPAPFRFAAKLTMPKRLLQPVLRAWPRPSAESNADCALRTRVYLQGRFPKVRRHRDGLLSQLQQRGPRTRPSEGVRDGSFSPVRRVARRLGIGSQLLPCGNPPEKFLEAFPVDCPGFSPTMRKHSSSLARICLETNASASIASLLCA